MYLIYFDQKTKDFYLLVRKSSRLDFVAFAADLFPQYSLHVYVIKRKNGDDNLKGTEFRILSNTPLPDSQRYPLKHCLQLIKNELDINV